MKCNKIILIIFIIFFITPTVCAVANTFQDWGATTNPLILPTSQIRPYSISQYNSSTGEILACGYSGGYFNNDGVYMSSNPASPFTYLAFNLYSTTQNTLEYYDQNLVPYTSSNYMSGFSNPTRVEMKIIGGQPTVFFNGVQNSQSPIINTNPYYAYSSPYFTGSCFDDIVVGGSDPHAVGVMPSNWTIIRDLINPSAYGLYAWNPNTNAWVLMNSNYFAIDADTSSQQSVSTETFNIVSLPSGTIVNTTTIYNQVSPMNILTFGISDFLNTQTSLGTSLPDGEYQAEFSGYPGSAATFWVISNGASLGWNSQTYSVGDTGTVNYAISNSYWLPTLYTYKIKIEDVYGNVVQTTPISVQSGSITYTFSSSNNQGIYYAEIDATPIGGGTSQTMNHAYTTLNSYMKLYGTVYSAQSLSTISGAIISINQSGTSTNNVATSGATGNYTVNGYLSGSSINTTVTASGYVPYTYTFIPLSTKTVNLNFTLEPIAPSFTGIGIGGVARDSTYGQPISGASILIKNITNNQSYIKTTNLAGWYLCDNGALCSLINGRLYAVNGSASGHSNSTTYNIVVSGS
jgi:hypothetical protein